MNDINSDYLSKHQDILSFRDLSQSTINNYVSYLSAFLTLTEAELPDVPHASRSISATYS